MELKEIVSQFALEGQVDQIKPLGTGLINDTFRVTTVEPTAPDYVLQRINHVVFTDVEMLQQNIQRVTEHIRHKLLARQIFLVFLLVGSTAGVHLFQLLKIRLIENAGVTGEVTAGPQPLNTFRIQYTPAL